jgi:hypothetical protein
MEPPIKPAAPVTNTFMEKLPAWISDARSIKERSLPKNAL